MNELNNRNLVTIKNNERVTTSLIIAEQFNKRHKDVLALIDECLRSDEISADLINWITPTFYTDSYNREQKMFNVTESGFMFIVTSFKGRKADIARIAFISEFNRMANKLNKPKPRQKLKADFTTDNVRLELFNNAPIKVTEYNGQNYYFFNDLRLAVGYRKSASRPWRNMRPFKKVKVINQDKVPNGIYNVVTVKDLQLIINDHGTNKPQLQTIDRFIKEHRAELTEQTTLLLIEPEQTSLALDVPAVDDQIKDFNKFKEYQEIQGWT